MCDRNTKTRCSQQPTSSCSSDNRGPRGYDGPPGHMGPRGPPGPPCVLDIRTLTHKRSEGSYLPFPRRPYGCAEVELPIELLNEPFTLEDNSKRILNTSRVQREKFSFYLHTSGIKFEIGQNAWSVDVEINMLLSKRNTNVSVVTIYDEYGLTITYEFLKHLHAAKARHQFWNPAWISAYLDASLMVLRPDIRLDLITISCLDDIATKSAYLLTELTHLDSQQLRTTEQIVASPISLPAEVLALITNNPTLNRSIADSVQQIRS